MVSGSLIASGRLSWAAAIARGMPCMFPEGVVNGEWISAWASIQITPNRSLGWARRMPAMVAAAVEWSPASTIANRPCWSVKATRSAASAITRVIASMWRAWGVAVPAPTSQPRALTRAEGSCSGCTAPLSSSIPDPAPAVPAPKSQSTSTSPTAARWAVLVICPRTESAMATPSSWRDWNLCVFRY